VIELRVDAKNENMRHLCIVKGNYLGKEYKQASFVLNFNSETFQFVDSGERISFEQLATQPAIQEKKKITPLNQFSDEVHKELLSKIFQIKAQYRYTELWHSLSNAYEHKTMETFGKDRSQKLLTFLLDVKKLIKRKGKEKAGVYEINF
jgi:hypothetical protein